MIVDQIPEVLFDGFVKSIRFQSILDGNLAWFLDGAHNKISLEVCAQWFAQTSSKMEWDLTGSLLSNNMLITNSSVCQVLIFGHYSSPR